VGRSRAGSRRVGRTLVALTAACALLAAACGDDDGGEAASASGGGGGGEDLQVVTDPPTEFTVDDPLPEPPEPKSIAFLVCPVPSCEKNVPFLTEAVEALGWEIEPISLDSANPGVAFQQALDGGFDYIALTGIPLSAIEEQMAEAQRRGIPVFECHSTDVAEGEANGLYSQCAGAESVGVASDGLADWVIEDSGGDANVLAVTIRDFPILVAEEDAMGAAFDERCPDCSLDSLPVTVDDLGAGEVPQQVASYLQSNPDVDYVWFTFSDLSVGVSDALEGAGVLEGRNLVGMLFEEPQLEEIAGGTHRAWVAVPDNYAMWVMADQMARYATGVWDADTEHRAAVLPTWVVDDPAVAEDLLETRGWGGPDGFEDHFRGLWGVS
jgi:ABC-type sugar transport system substrate-binding protein